MTNPLMAALIRPVRWLALAAAVAVLAGCASGPATDPRDPLERYNRGMSEFNEQVDALVLKPVAVAYRDVTPAPVRTGVSNFFGNLGDLWSAANNLLQLRVEEAATTFMRFNVNTLMGIGGILDIASELGIERHRNDFGLTLGRWGVPTGPYLVLPILGPSTVRDAFALPVDMRGNALGFVEPASDRTALYALRLVDVRSNLLRASNVLDSVALDKYSFTRDVFLQVRGQEGFPPLFGSQAPFDGGDGRLPQEPPPAR